MDTHTALASTRTTSAGSLTLRGLLLLALAGAALPACSSRRPAPEKPLLKQATYTTAPQALAVLHRADARGDQPTMQRVVRDLDRRWLRDLSQTERMYVTVIQGDLARASGDPVRAQQHYRAVLAAHRRLPDIDRNGQLARDHAARATFGELELVRAPLDQIQLGSDTNSMKRELINQTKIIRQVQQHAQKVAAYRSPAWTVASMYRVGEAYELFARALRDAPIPDALQSSQAADVFRETLERYAVPLDRKAATAHKIAVTLAQRERVNTVWSRRADSALARLDPSTHQQLHRAP